MLELHKLTALAIGNGWGSLLSGLFAGLVAGALASWAVFLSRRGAARPDCAGSCDVLDALPVLVGIVCPDGVVEEVNRAALESAGLQRDQVVGLHVADTYWLNHGDDLRNRVDAAIRRVVAGGTERMDLLVRVAGGRLIPMEVTFSPMKDARGHVNRVVATGLDVAVRKQMEQKARLSEEMFSKAFSNNPAAIVVTRLEDGVVLDVNETLLEMVGETRGNVIHKSARHMWPSERDIQGFITQLKEKGSLHGWEQAFLKKSGELFHTQISSRVITMHGETVVLSTLVDITARKRMEETLRESEERFRELAETIGDVFWITDPSNHRMIYISPGYERIWGRTCQSLYDAPRAWLDAVHPDDRERVRLAADVNRASGGYTLEYRIMRPDGRERWIRDQAFPVVKNGGEVLRTVGVARDITEFRMLEEQLRQSQKMDAIGQLAGGVAHDFNNILAAMVMQADLASRARDLPEMAKSMIGEIREGCMRAADLTRQLLAFGRRQAILPRLLDLNESVLKLHKMLQRIMPASVDMFVRLHPHPLMLTADPGSLDQVLLNLAVNARDAMHEGGRLIIETSQVDLDESQAATFADIPPGPYACLTVADDGCGISPDILSRVFEPFFTTKEIGKGVGLGLSTVFGIVRQHGGKVTVESLPDRGATFRVLLPSSSKAGQTAQSSPAPSPRGGTKPFFSWKTIRTCAGSPR